MNTVFKLEVNNFDFRKLVIDFAYLTSVALIMFLTTAPLWWKLFL